MLSCISSNGVYYKGSNGEHQEFLCDTAADVANLPMGGAPNQPCPGSTAYVIETGETYILSNALIWVKKIGGEKNV